MPRVDYSMTEAHAARGELVPQFEGWSAEPMPRVVAFSMYRLVSAKLPVFLDWVAELKARQAPNR